MAEYIEREALIAHIKDVPTWLIHGADDNGMYGIPTKYPDGMFDAADVVSSIENAPAADVAPVVHAKWEFDKLWYHLNCSNCRGFVQGNCDDYKFCPNCGARMDGE